MAMFNPSQPKQRPPVFRAEREFGDTLREPELAIATALVRAFSKSAITLPATDSTAEGRVTVRYGDDELDGLRATLTTRRALRRASVPASLLARRSFGPPLPRTDDE
jgi:hypothetical protein